MTKKSKAETIQTKDKAGPKSTNRAGDQEMVLLSITDSQSRHQPSKADLEKNEFEAKEKAFRDSRNKTRQDIVHAEKIGSFHADKSKTIKSLAVGSSIKSNAISELYLPDDNREVES